tara:strand:+ start:487 stop:1068 length:582 start_codon:yes stop_codon:yes gene_type:complete
MKFKRPAAKATLDIAFWFTLRADSSGIRLSHQKLQYLLFLSQGHYIGNHSGAKLMPASFFITDSGPIEPNIYHLYQSYLDNKLSLNGNILSLVVEDFLTKMWALYGNLSEEHLLSIIKKNKEWKKILKSDSWKEISINFFYNSFSEDADLLIGNTNSDNNILLHDDEKEYWTMTGKRAKKWIPGLSKRSKKIN